MVLDVEVCAFVDIIIEFESVSRKKVPVFDTTAAMKNLYLGPLCIAESSFPVIETHLKALSLSLM